MLEICVQLGLSQRPWLLEILVDLSGDCVFDLDDILPVEEIIRVGANHLRANDRVPLGGDDLDTQGRAVWFAQALHFAQLSPAAEELLARELTRSTPDEGGLFEFADAFLRRLSYPDENRLRRLAGEEPAIANAIAVLADWDDDPSWLRFLPPPDGH